MGSCYCHSLSWIQQTVYAKNDGEVPTMTKWIKLTYRQNQTNAENVMTKSIVGVQLGIIESNCVLLWKSCSEITLANMVLIISRRALRENTSQLTNESASSWWNLFAELHALELVIEESVYREFIGTTWSRMHKPLSLWLKHSDVEEHEPYYFIKL